MEVKLPREKSPAEALEALMDRCARAELCLWDARRLLVRWQVPRSEWEAILQQLVDERFIDERRYAEAFVRDKLKFSRWGVRKIADALYRKQFPRELIAGALEPIDAGSMDERLETDLRRKNESIRDTDSRKRRDKLLRFGLSRGFDMQQVMDVIARIARTEED